MEVSPGDIVQQFGSSKQSNIKSMLEQILKLHYHSGL